MDVWFLTKIRKLLLSQLILVTLACPSLSFANNSLLQNIDVLDNDFKSLSSEFYKSNAANSKYASVKFDDINKLETSVDKLVSSHHTIDAITLLYNNQTLIIDNLDNKAVFRFITLLLQNNEWYLANTFFKAITDEGDKSLTSTVNFEFAKYYADRKNWNKVNSLLKNTFNDLTTENAEYAYLLNGVALQNLRRHREAIRSYKKIPQTSKYYLESQINIATACIRLGWWTDADIIVKKLTNSPDINLNHNKELTNRLYLVLGYELLQKEYYRNARNAFRKVKLDSRYTNRALLGIGLTAVSQGDYIGGLNALSILKSKKTMDLSADEAYLVLPYIYNRLQQEVTVTASYNEAINYYSQRINSLDNLLSKSHQFSDLSYNQTNNTVTIASNSFDYGSEFPSSFLTNYHLLNELNNSSSNANESSKINKLLARYNSSLQDVMKILIDKRVKYLNSYLSQARYGLAMLFDSSQK